MLFDERIGVVLPTVVIMVGGYGKRLFPLTESIPKPLLEIGDEPVLGQILDVLSRQGFRHVVLCAHFQASKILEFVEAYQLTSQLTVEVVIESEPTGTAGGLRLLQSRFKLNGPFIVTNGDVLTDLNYADFIATHRQQKNTITVASRYYKQQVPYGVLAVNVLGEITGLKEKPVQVMPINCGTYVIESNFLASFPESGRLDMTDVIELAIAQRHRVGSYLFDEYWMDIGKPEDYKQANLDCLMRKSLGKPAGLSGLKQPQVQRLVQ